jgi:hypothetical protein
MFMCTCTLSKKIRSKIAKIKKLVTRTPVSTKRTNRVASKNHTSGRDKKFVLSNLISRGLRGKHTEKSDQNSEKNFSVLAGLNHTTLKQNVFFFYVTDGNIMYLTDASRFLISCVIQHYAPVVGWGGA